MEFLLLSFLLICTAATISATDPTFCNPGTGIVMTPLGNCSHFDITVGNQSPSVVKNVKACPVGLLFDTNSCVCNWRCDVACGAIYPFIESGFVPVPNTVKLGPLMKVGNTIKVTGTPNANANGIAISFCKNDGCDSFIALQFGIRFTGGGYIGDINQVVINDKAGSWSNEVRPSGFPFKRGEQFTLSIKMLADKYKMTATSSGRTNDYELTYRQLPLMDFTLLEVAGAMPTVKIEVTDE